jgi:hypothetical protein
MNKSYVEEMHLCFYITCSLIVILKNYHQPTLAYYIDKYIFTQIDTHIWKRQCGNMDWTVDYWLRILSSDWVFC